MFKPRSYSTAVFEMRRDQLVRTARSAGKSFFYVAAPKTNPDRLLDGDFLVYRTEDHKRIARVRSRDAAEAQVIERSKNAPPPTPELPDPPSDGEIIAKLAQAVRLVLALDMNPPGANVPGFLVRLDPMAKKQLYSALALVPAV